MAKNFQEQLFKTSLKDRIVAKGHRPLAIWFTGLSGAGKSTIADALEQKLIAEKIHTYILDGDNIRHGICRDLDFSSDDRTENIRRVGEMTALFVDAGITVISSFISPFIADREIAKQTIGQDYFLEVYINTSLKTCEERDPKGLYKKVRSGSISNFTGISSPYEEPINPDIEIKTEHETVEEAVEKIWNTIQPKLKL
ncbi:MAG: adenylylsulfate kinase [Crocinitomicaceae bacterium]|jgi:adenylylsulfate kinase